MNNKQTARILYDYVVSGYSEEAAANRNGVTRSDVSKLLHSFGFNYTDEGSFNSGKHRGLYKNGYNYTSYNGNSFTYKVKLQDIIDFVNKNSGGSCYNDAFEDYLNDILVSYDDEDQDQEYDDYEDDYEEDDHSSGKVKKKKASGDSDGKLFGKAFEVFRDSGATGKILMAAGTIIGIIVLIFLLKTVLGAILSFIQKYPAIVVIVILLILAIKFGPGLLKRKKEKKHKTKRQGSKRDSGGRLRFHFTVPGAVFAVVFFCIGIGGLMNGGNIILAVVFCLIGLTGVFTNRD